MGSKLLLRISYSVNFCSFCFLVLTPEDVFHAAKRRVGLKPDPGRTNYVAVVPGAVVVAAAAVVVVVIAAAGRKSRRSNLRKKPLQKAFRLAKRKTKAGKLPRKKAGKMAGKMAVKLPRKMAEKTPWKMEEKMPRKMAWKMAGKMRLKMAQRKTEYRRL